MPAKDKFKKLCKECFDAFTGKKLGIAQQKLEKIAEGLDAMLSVPAAAEEPGDSDSGYTLRTAMVAQGETVTPNDTVYVINNVAYLADASGNRPVHGVCVRGTGKQREILWRLGGTATAKVKRNTGTASYGTLYQSATPGWLTNDPNESGIVSVQAVGHFGQWSKPVTGVAPIEVARVDLSVSAAAGGGGGGVTLAQAVAAAQCPTYIGPTETYTVYPNRQVLFAHYIDNEGTLDVQGVLVQVD